MKQETVKQGEEKYNHAYTPEELEALEGMINPFNGYLFGYYFTASNWEIQSQTKK